MNLKDYFDPVSVEADYRLGEKSSFGPQAKKNLTGNKFPDWAKADIAIIGVSEFRNVHLENSALAATQARKALYELSAVHNKMNIADLGDLKTGNTINDSFAGLRDVMSALLEKNTLPLVIGGNRELTLAMFRSYENNKKTINLTSVDSRAGLAGNSFHGEMTTSCLNNIISSKSKYLFNYTNIGYQSYFTGNDEINLMDDLLFDSFRLGAVKESLKEMEPVLRDTDLLTISMSSIRQSDAPAAIFPSPNGFSGEEVCQLAFYAGRSERPSSLALFDWYAEYDRRSHTAHQAAQAAWYFIDGFYKRKGEYPFNPSINCTKFIVNVTGKGNENEIIFYKSTRTGRWWMEVPSSKLPRGLIIACSYEDYQRACLKEIPDRWWQNFKKINH